jgi:DNA-binding LytR/AlgR family response regulator
MKIKCIIVDDEPLSLKVIEGHLKKIPYVEVIKTFQSAIPVYEFIADNQVDLIFLDIEMPGLTGIDFIKSLKEKPAIVITSAKKEYAIEGFDLDVDDYLVKPLTFERLLKAVNKVAEGKISSKKTVSQNNRENDYIYLKENKRMVKVYLKNIIYLESLKDYIRVVTTCKTVITKLQLNYFEEILDNDDFIRIHRSFIIAKNKIDAYSSSTIELGDTELPIGRKYKDVVLEKLSKLNIIKDD